MQVSQDQSQQQTQSQRIAPHLIQASEILQCSSIELAQAVELELLENPALESSETSGDLCPGCPASAANCGHCPFAGQSAATAVTATTFAEIVAGESRTNQTSDEAAHSETDTFAEPTEETDGETWNMELTTFYQDGQEQADTSDEAFDPVSLAASTTDLRDQVLSAMRAMSVCECDSRVAEYLVSCLDDRGWLKVSEPEAATELGVGIDDIVRGISKMQSCDPPGIGARDLRECLLIQLQHLHEDNRGNPLLRKMVDKYWDEIVQRRFPQIARRLNVTVEQVNAAIAFLQNELTPNPASNYRQPWEYKPDAKSEAVKPDVLIRRTATGFDVEVLGMDLPALHVNARYRLLYELMKNPSGAVFTPAQQAERAIAVSKLGTQEKHHIIQYVERATQFMKNIQQRKRTIERITRCMIEAQQGFIETGSRAFLRPMTRTDLAHQAHVHESTVSRALLRKYVQLPNQDVMSFDEFFTSAGSIKDTIEQLIAGEDPRSPYSDEKIRQILAESGQDIARRTVVKYRESMRIPASYLRRSH